MGMVAQMQEYRRPFALVMFGLTALLVIDLAYQVAAHLQWRAWIPASLAAPVPSTQPATTQPADTQPAASQPVDTQPAATQPSQTQPAEPVPAPDPPKPPPGPPALAAELVERNLMAPPVPQVPKLRLTGVIGQTALFVDHKNRPVAIDIGQANRGVKVVKIEGYAVTVEVDGKEQVMQLFPPTPGAPPPSPPATRAAPPGHSAATPATQPASDGAAPRNLQTPTTQGASQ